jgi:hypothetical protein
MNSQNPDDLILAKGQLYLERKRENTITILRLKVTYCLLALFALNVLCVLAIIFLVGFGKMSLSERLIIILLGETMAQAAAIFFSVTKFIFPSK